ncbi:MAG: ATPase [Bacteroidales bacterium]|nr:ATPase [Bacteroidales bacterium]MCF8343731.1 ATPase [Bacteroidales bacterium]MCF8349649.1 ATPase [Bacteroidales bacterium]MCF8374895.1 ATPase [Bacteroidales bacterium]MCF8400126.1 ATPase [Bacteroidales bacterium]
MILIADSGTTKTDWCLVDAYGYPKYLETAGFNPYYMDSDTIRNILEKELTPLIDEKNIKELYFYGSGCSTNTKRLIVDNALSDTFTEAHIEVEHDLLGAARGLLGRDAGIACILGTGSNSCYYDGQAITENIPSLGYLYGDEGSGAYIGRKLLEAYLKNKLPEEINLAFTEKHELSLEQILDATYNREKPNQFMASFVPFVAEHIDNDFLRNLVRASFEDFMQNQVFRYSRFRENAIHFSGSIAFIFKDILERVLKEYDLKMGKIIKKPIEGLAGYHFPE